MLKKKVIKVSISIVLIIALLNAVCMQSYAVVNTHSTVQSIISEAPSGNMKFAAYTHATNDGMGNVDQIWGALAVSKLDPTDNYVLYTPVDLLILFVAVDNQESPIGDVFSSSGAIDVGQYWSSIVSAPILIEESDNFSYAECNFSVFYDAYDSNGNYDPYIIWDAGPTYTEFDLLTDSP